MGTLDRGKTGVVGRVGVEVSDHCSPVVVETLASSGKQLLGLVCHAGREGRK
jgi:hypothetical protein